MGDGHSEDIFINLEKTDVKYKRLVQRVLEIDRRIHGPGDVQVQLNKIYFIKFNFQYSNVSMYELTKLGNRVLII